MMMGVGNLTELTDVDSAGVNTLLVGILPGAEHPERPDDGRDQLGAVVGPRARPGAAAGASCRDAAGRCPSTSSRAWSLCATPRSPIRRREPGRARSGGSTTRTGGSSPRVGMIHALNNQQFL